MGINPLLPCRTLRGLSPRPGTAADAEVARGAGSTALEAALLAIALNLIAARDRQKLCIGRGPVVLETICWNQCGKQWVLYSIEPLSLI